MIIKRYEKEYEDFLAECEAMGTLASDGKKSNDNIIVFEDRDETVKALPVVAKYFSMFSVDIPLGRITLVSSK